MSLKDTLKNYDLNPPTDPNNVKNFLKKFEAQSDYDNAFNTFADNVDVDSEDSGFYSNNPYNSDYLDGSESELGTLDLNEYKAQAQPTSTKIGRGLGRVVNETLMNVLEIPGVAIGGIGALGNELFGSDEGSLDMMVNNWWVNMLEKEKEWFNNEFAPVYVKKSVQEGNLWDNISSVDFWATEGASGLAFLASALAPGFAVKALGTGTKLANAMGKSKKGLDLLQKTDDIAKNIGLGNTANATDIFGATVANTMFEAGIEARGAMEAYQEELDGLFNSGEITEEKYISLSNKAADQGSKVFKDNLGILLLPNLIMSKALIGKALPNKQLNKFKVDGSKITPELKKLTLGDKITNASKLVGQATLTEGLIEEMGQMTSEKMRTENFLNDQIGKESKSWVETYMNVLGSTEGQKALFLGSLFGTGATAIGNYRQNKANQTRLNQLSEIMTNGVNFFETATDGIYTKDETGKLVVDQEKVSKLGEEMDFLQSLISQKEELLEMDSLGVKGAKEYADLIDHNIVNNMLYSFVHAGQEGISILKNYLENSSGLENLVNSINENREIKRSKDEVVADLITEATNLKSDLEYYSNYGEFKNELYKKESDIEFYPEYSKIVKNKYISSKSNLRYLKNKQSELETALSKAKEDLKEDETNDVIDSINNQLKENQTLQNSINKELNNLLNSTKQQKEFSKFVKNKEKVEKAKEDSKSIDDIINKISNTSNEQELEEIKKDPIYSKYQESIDKKIDERKKQIEKNRELDAQNANQEAEQINNAQEQEVDDYNENLESIGNNFNVGETIVLPETFKNNAGQRATILEIKKNKKGNVRIVFDVEGSDQTLSFEVANAVTSKSNQSITEGSNSENTIDHNENASLDTKDLEEDANKDTKPSMDSKVISTNKKTGEVLPGLFEDDNNLLEFERNPINKIGTKVNFEIDIKPNPLHPKIFELKKAIDRFNKLKNGEDISKDDMYHIIDYLPIKIKINNSDNIYSYLMTKPVEGSKQQAFDTYRNRTRQLRINLLNKIKEGKSIESLQTTITGQYGGMLQLDGYAQNNILDLDYIKGDLSKVKLYMLNDNGDLVDYSGKLAKSGIIGKQNWKGSVYLNIKKANGEDFYLHTNFSKVSKDQANVTYEIYKSLLENYNIKYSSSINTLSDELQNQIKNTLSDEISLIQKVGNKNIDDITITELLDLLFWDGSKSVKSRLKIDKGTIRFGKNVLTKKDLNQDNKELFIDWVSKNKNRNVKFKAKSNDSNPSMNLSNKDYLEYILNQKVLNTNAVVGKPTFAGFTNMYMSNEISDSNTTNESIERIENTQVTAEEQANAIEPETFDFANITKKDINKTDNISSSQENLVSLQDKIGTEENQKVTSQKRTRGKKAVTMRERKLRAKQNRDNNSLDKKC